MTEPKKAPAKRAPRGAAKNEADAEEVLNEILKDTPIPAGTNGPAEPEGRDWTGAFKNDRLEVMGPPVELTFPSVHQQWCRVMESVRSIEKGDVNRDQHFRFRGIDAVMEAVGPALRQHGVHVRPRRILEHSVTEYTSKNGARMVNRLVRIEWEVTGPGGDSFTAESMGEAADSSDKSMTKAQSVAYRVFLLNSLTVPTGDPDPDAETPERAGPSERQQAVAQASEKTYTSREEFERERAAQAQQETRQAQAGEDNQAAQADLEKARAEMWRIAKGLGWQWGPLVARYKSDHGGTPPSESNVKDLETFAAELVAEAQEEEDRAKQLVQNELGGNEVQPDEAQSGGLL